jgi:hypothetical protein
MTHDWTTGVKLLGLAQLSTCARCGTLRVEEDGRTRYIRSTYDPILRVMVLEPPCMRLERTRGEPPASIDPCL